MAEARREFMGGLVAYEIAWMAKLLTGEQIDPNSINPYATRATPKVKSAARIEAENQAGWAILDRFMSGK